MSKMNKPSKPKTSKYSTESSKEPEIVRHGIVKKRLPDANFEVELEGGYLLKKAYVAGRMRKNYIQIALGDTVTVEMNRYDLSKGRIIFRGIKDKHQVSVEK